jgi:regulator of sigma E protease
MITLLSFIVVLGITITVHEFGHFAMAKLLKIRVLIFSLGFGPKLVGFSRGGTEYRLSPIPLGGYVKMAGEAYDDNRQGEPDEFLSHPKWHRFLVAVSGPFMNILLAVVILTVSFMQGVYIPRYPQEPAIAGPVAADSIAKRAGLETGDLIVSVNNNPVKTWADLELALRTASRESLTLELLRNGRTLRLHLEEPSSEQIDAASLGFKFTLPKTMVYAVDEDSPAYRGGLKAGDQILSARSREKTGSNYNEILNLISESNGIPLTVTVRRPNTEPPKDQIWESSETKDATILSLTITPEEKDGRVLIGFVPDYPSDFQKYGIILAFRQSVRRNIETTALIFKILGRILKGSASVRTLSGPIDIARISGSAGRAALSTGSPLLFFEFLGLISLHLGVFNLLPIPILDGGVIVLLLIEGVIRRDLSLGLKERIVQVGFVFLILLMGFVVFNDLSKIIDFNQLFR